MSVAKPHPGRAGLTLLELLVVLTILVALAGVVIPLLPSMLGRSHNASVATNVSAISQMIQNYQQLNAGYPDQWDALGDTTQMIDYFAGGSGSPTGTGSTSTQVGGQLTTATLTATDVVALNSAGIYNVHPMVTPYAAGQTTAGWDPTFNPYANPPVTNTGTLNTGTPLAQGMVFPSLTGVLTNQIFGASPTGKYILLGIGQRNTMIGKVMSEPPVVFGDNPNLSPTVAYVRFVAVFKVSENNGNTALSNALFVGVVEPDDSGLHTANHEIQEWYNQK